MDISQRERVIDLQNMSEEQLKFLIENLNKELENAKQDFQNRLKRILLPFGIYYTVLVKIGTKEEVEDFVKEVRQNTVEVNLETKDKDSSVVETVSKKTGSKSKTKVSKKVSRRVKT